MADSVKRGYLYKTPPKAFKNSDWKKRFFELFANGDLAYSKSHHLKDDPKGVVRLREVTHISDAQCSLLSLYAIGLHVPGRVYYLKAESRDILDQWCIAFQKYIPSYSSLDLIQKEIPQYYIVPKEVTSQLPVRRSYLIREGRQRYCELNEGHLRIYINYNQRKLDSLYEIRTFKSVQELPDTSKFMFSIDFITGGQVRI